MSGLRSFGRMRSLAPSSDLFSIDMFEGVVFVLSVVCN